MAHRILVVALLAGALLATPAPAFYEYRGEDSSLDLRGFADLSAANAWNPDFPLLYKNTSDQIYGASARLLALGTAGSHFGFEFNGLAYGFGGTAAFPVFAPDVERSGAPEWKINDGSNQRSHLLIDHLNIRASFENTDLTVGRQAVNLATCFYFTPNDIFAPFSAQTFYRVYKPGVDAARLEIKLGELSQLSLIEALGYTPSAAGINGWSAWPEGGRAITVARAATAFANFQWAVLAGKMADAPLYGGSLQGELFKWLGVRAEGHVSNPPSGQYTEVSAGIEHRFENSLTVRYEQFHHGSGSGAPSQYLAGVSAGNPPQYLGMNYGAIGLGYQFSPLLNGEMVAITNWTDSSHLISLYGVYSLSDESEIALGVNLPYGPRGGPLQVESEYGLSPTSVYADLRMYF